MQVTVIIPIHNSEKYIRKCVESAQLQTFKDIEILCIDGGSTDRSGEIIEKLQKNDTRIIYVSDPNTSYGHKINVGIAKAKGKYISILESDDRMAPNMVAHLYEIAERYDTDVADSDYCDFFSYKGKEWSSTIHKYSYPKDYEHLLNDIEKDENRIVSNGIWTALYKREFLVQQNIQLNESSGASYQDLSFLFLTSFLAKRVYHMDTPLYQYRVDNVESSVKDDRKIFEIIGECAYLKQELEKRGVHTKEEWKLYYTRKYNAFHWNYCRLSEVSRRLFLDKVIEELKKDLKTQKINREMFAGDMYDRTFLILDDQEEYIKKVDAGMPKLSYLKLIDIVTSIEDRGVVIFGAGIWGIRAVEFLRQNGNMILGICDNEETLHGTIRGGLKISAVEETVAEYPQAFYLIASSKYGEDMKEQLLKEKISEENIAIVG